MELQVFKHEQFGELRTVEIDNTVWFVGKDVAERLGYQKPLDALSRHVDEDDSVKHGLTDSLGRMQETVIINESGLYSLVLSSKLPNAKQFKRWVTSEVLPSIRKHGAYMTNEVIEQALTSPDFLIQLATELKKEKDKNLQLQATNSKLTVENTIMQPKAEYFDELVDRNLLTGIRETAKELKVKEKKFVQFLLDKRYLFRNKKGKLEPYANKNNGLFELKETFNEKSNWSGTQLFITPKGRETFRLLCI